jgi:hypothetical protein
MSKPIESKLKTLREFQVKHPTAHVGGSIGLFLRGIDLKRDLAKSDLDITVDEFDLRISTEYEERSDNNDFDFSVKDMISESVYVKIDIRISPEPSYDVVVFDGNSYNVSKVKDILWWKQKYADKGVDKHRDDLITIKTGIRPEVKETSFSDDLPF